MDAAPKDVGLADGDMPRELAHRMNDRLHDVLSLLHAVSLEIADDQIVDRFEDAEGMNSASSRGRCLISMADEAVRDVMRAMSPYV
ncbi:MAG TPA: hypothetical protein VF457_06065 [Burkholderiaceae bacterium]